LVGCSVWVAASLLGGSHRPGVARQPPEHLGRARRAVCGQPGNHLGPHYTADYLRGSSDLETPASLRWREDLGCATYVR
jgi:hypothetical protein